MKKFIIGVSIGLIVLTTTLIFGVVFGPQPIELLAIKNGVINSNYLVGELFDKSVGTLVVKKDGKFFEVPISDPEVKVQGFDSSKAVKNAIAQLVYKGKSVSFTYNINLRPTLMLETQDVIVTYDGQNHDILYTVTEGTTVTKQRVKYSADNQLELTNFTGEKNAGIYTILVTASKAGFEDNQHYVTLVIKQKEINAQLVVDDNLVYDGHGKGVRVENKTGVCGDDVVGLTIYTGDGNSDATSGENRTAAGEYYSYFASVNNTNYILGIDCPVKNNPYRWEIAKADYVKAGGGALTAQDVGFTDSTCVYDGLVKKIVCTEQLIIDETPISPSYEYRKDNEIVSYNGVTEAGVYEVTAIYSFSNYKDVRFTATLRITEPSS